MSYVSNIVLIFSVAVLDTGRLFPVCTSCQNDPSSSALFLRCFSFIQTDLHKIFQFLLNFLLFTVYYQSFYLAHESQCSANIPAYIQQSCWTCATPEPLSLVALIIFWKMVGIVIIVHFQKCVDIHLNRNDNLHFRGHAKVSFCKFVGCCLVPVQQTELNLHEQEAVCLNYSGEKWL